MAYAAKENELQKLICKGKQIEVSLPNGTSADCIDDEYAIEVEFTEKWVEAIGQSLNYAAVTRKKPAIYLICKTGQEGCLKHQLRLEETISYWGLEIRVFLFDEKEILEKGQN